MCLGQDDCIDLKAAVRDTENPKAALHTALDRAIGKKPEKHEFEIGANGQTSGVSRHMSTTGG